MSDMQFESLSRLQRELCLETASHLPDVLVAVPMTRPMADLMQPQEFEALNASCLDFMSRVHGRPIFSTLEDIDTDAGRLADTVMMVLQRSAQFGQIVKEDALAYHDIRQLVQAKALEVALQKCDST